MLPFSQSLGGTFVYDDHALIEQRSAIHSLSRLPELFKGEFWQGLDVIHFRYLRPLVSMSYAIDWAIYGGRPAGFHATNLLLHALVALLVYTTLRRWSLAPWGALVATLAWAWHPSKVEAVSWISGRTDLFAALGILITCAGVKRRLDGLLRSGLLLEILGVAIGLGSKESAVVIPAFVFVEAWVFYGRRRLDRMELVHAGSVALPYAIVMALYVAARLTFLPVVPEGAGAMSFIDSRLYTLESLGEFTRIAIYPYPLSIERAPIRVDAAMRVLHDRARLVLGIATVLSLAGAFWAVRGRYLSNGRCVGYLLGASALLPVSNVLSSRMVFLFAERFAYVPLMGFAFSFVPVGKATVRNVGAWGIVLVSWFALSVAHTRHFLDDRSLWEHELSVNASDPLALRFACEDAMLRRENRAAMDFALRGYKAAASWPVARPDRIEFAARAARSLELLTLDHDRATLEQIVEFYRGFFTERGVARFDGPTFPVVVASDGDEAKKFRHGDPARVRTMKLWAAVAASRVERCEVALPMVHDYISGSSDPRGRVSAAIVLARCGSWGEAHDVARRLQTTDTAFSDLAENIAWAETIAREDHDSLDGALRWSRAQTLLLQRGKAYEALLPWQPEILADAQGSVFFARVAWAAGEDDAARRALAAAHMGQAETTTLLATWSHELGRD